MDKKYIIETVNSALGEEFELDPEKLKPSADIREELRMDSLDMLDMILTLEKAFNFKLGDRAKVRHIKTLGDIYDFIDKQAKDGLVSR